MRFNIENESSVDYFEDNKEEIKISRNSYLCDSDEALKLVSKVMQISGKQDETAKSEIKSAIREIFEVYKNENLENVLKYYKQFMLLCDRLSEMKRLNRVGDKVVIGVGGKFSSGKSKFLNRVASLEGLLPESTKPTTAIPTYILFDTESKCIVNNKYNSSFEITKEELNAISHEFYDEYKMGFSSVLDSIVVCNPKWDLSKKISLLDTPGYNKYDNKNMEDAADRIKAHDQLKVADFLIWLVDIDNGELQQDDIDFISKINIETPILIVMNKCDKKTKSNIELTINSVFETVNNNGINCYGIVGYSAASGEQSYARAIHKDANEGSENFIGDFFEFVSKSNLCEKNLDEQYDNLKDVFFNCRRNFKQEKSNIVEELRKFIIGLNNLESAHEIINLWSIAQNEIKQHEENEKVTESKIKALDGLFKNTRKEE